MRTNCHIIKNFVQWHNVEVFLIPACERPEVFVPAPDRRIGGEPSPSLLVPSASFFGDYSILMLCGSNADILPLWKIEITYFLLFARLSFVVAARVCVLTSKTADPRIVEDGWGCWCQ